MTIIVTMSDEVAGREIAEVLGVVEGSIVRARFIGRDFTAAIRNFIGGEVPEYTRLLEESRRTAYGRMVTEAEKLGADAIVTFRFTTSAIMEGAAEILAYGAAVRLK